MVVCEGVDPFSLQAMLLRFPGACLGQGVAEPHVLGLLELRDVLNYGGHDFVCTGFGIGLEHDRCRNFFLKGIVGQDGGELLLQPGVARYSRLP